MGVLMASEEEVAPILANFRRYNDFSIEDILLPCLSPQFAFYFL